VEAGVEVAVEVGEVVQVLPEEKPPDVVKEQKTQKKTMKKWSMSCVEAARVSVTIASQGRTEEGLKSRSITITG
jgi:predicted anti-sigma-YlaC factor YlaD